ncbi:MAG TPA: hypothetical protein V6D13_08470 [Halomicronema sp.]
MQTINNLQLPPAKPSDRPHILLIENVDETHLQHISFYNNAKRINYRQNLLNRLKPADKFLLLHLHLDRELNAIRFICAENKSEVIILDKLDYLITYLAISPNSILSLFWQKLSTMRHLEAVLWIVLPPTLTPPPVWPEKQIFRLYTSSN